MTFRLVAKKTVALTLIITPLIHTFAAVNDIILILPRISSVINPAIAQQLYQQLIYKAIIISTSLFIDSIYGFSLLIKPLPATKLIHIVFGILLFILSAFVLHTSSINHLLQQLPVLPLT